MSDQDRQLRLSPSLVWPAVITVLIGIVYFPVMRELVRDWIRDPNYAHGFVIPLVSLWFVWRSRQRYANLPRSPSWWGLGGVVIALGIFVFGAAGAEVFTQRVSLLLLGASLVAFLSGWKRLRLVAFPIAFLTLAIPLPYVIYYGLTLPLQALAAKLAVHGLSFLGVPAIVQGNIIHLAGGNSLEVAEACSGIRSLYAFLAAGALMAYSSRVAWWGRILILALAIPLTIAGNAFRVWGSGLGAWLFGMDVTRGTLHEMFGLLVFVVTLAVFYLLRKVAQSIWLHGTSLPSSSSASRESMPPSSGMAPPR